MASNGPFTDSNSSMWTKPRPALIDTDLAKEIRNDHLYASQTNTCASVFTASDQIKVGMKQFGKEIYKAFTGNRREQKRLFDLQKRILKITDAKQKHDKNIQKCRDKAEMIKQKRSEHEAYLNQKAETKREYEKQLDTKRAHIRKESIRRRRATVAAKKNLIKSKTENANLARRIKKYNNKVIKAEKRFELNYIKQQASKIDTQILNARNYKSEQLVEASENRRQEIELLIKDQIHQRIEARDKRMELKTQERALIYELRDKERTRYRIGRKLEQMVRDPNIKDLSSDSELPYIEISAQNSDRSSDEEEENLSGSGQIQFRVAKKSKSKPETPLPSQTSTILLHQVDGQTQVQNVQPLVDLGKVNLSALEETWIEMELFGSNGNSEAPTVATPATAIQLHQVEEQTTEQSEEPLVDLEKVNLSTLEDTCIEMEFAENYGNQDEANQQEEARSEGRKAIAEA